MYQLEKMPLTDEQILWEIQNDYTPTDQLRILSLLAERLANQQVIRSLREIERHAAQTREDMVLEIVADVYCCTVADITGTQRAYRDARFCAASLLYARALCDMTQSRIAKILRPTGDLDHTTIIYYIDNVVTDTRYYEAAFRVGMRLGVHNDEIERLPQRTGHKRYLRRRARPVD